MKTVSNTTPIISLSSIGKISLLEALFTEIIIPQAVYDEIKAKKSYGYHEVDSDFIKVVSVQENDEALLEELDVGEAQTIMLANELAADNTLIDEQRGYVLAKESGLNVIRTLSILLKAKESRLISDAKPLVDEMILRGRWYSRHVYYAFLKRAGEI